MRIGAIAAAVAGVSLGLAPAASAAPGDVTATASVTGSDVTISYHNNSESTILCSGYGLLDPKTPTGENMPDIVAEPVFQPIEPGTSLDAVALGVSDGSYHFYWACFREGVFALEWGTVPMPAPTAEPLPVIVGSGECFGPSCPPPGKAVGRPGDMPNPPGPKNPPPAGPWAN